MFVCVVGDAMEIMVHITCTHSKQNVNSERVIFSIGLRISLAMDEKNPASAGWRRGYCRRSWIARAAIRRWYVIVSINFSSLAALAAALRLLVGCFFSLYALRSITSYGFVGFLIGGILVLAQATL